MWNWFSSTLVSKGLWNFVRGCKIYFPQFRKACEIHFPQLWFRKACKISHRVAKFIFHGLALCPIACTPFGHFACYAKISHSHVKLLDVRSLLWFSSLHTWLIWQRLWGSPKLGFFTCLSFNLLCHGLYKILPHSWFILMIKKLSKTPKLAKNLLETFARVFNVPIELKCNKYYSKVFKRVYNKL